jgi:hypothetical protein
MVSVSIWRVVLIRPQFTCTHGRQAMATHFKLDENEGFLSSEIILIV